MDPSDDFTQTSLIELTRLLVARLERISADSTWAHRSSGLRGALLRRLDELESVRTPVDPVSLERLINEGFWMLEGAAREKSGGRSDAALP